MGIYALGVVCFSFVFFVIVAEQFNPFVKPKQYVKRSKWKLGRKFGGGALVCGMALLAFGQLVLKTS